MNTANNDEMEIDLRDIFGLLRSKMWILVLAVVLTAAAAGIFSKLFITPIYTSTTKLYIVNKSQSLSSLSLSDLQLGTQLTKDYMVLVKSRPVTEQVIENLGLNMDHEGLLQIMSINNPADTRLLEIAVNYPDAFMAKEIVDEIAAVSSKRIATIMDMSEPRVAEEGHKAEAPTSPNIIKNALIAGLLGLFVSAAVICLLYILDDTIKSSEDVEKYLGIHTIGLIPIEENEELIAAGWNTGKKK